MAFADTKNEKSFQYLMEVETVAQNILTDKDTKLDLSNTRNKLREALRGVQVTEDRKTWIQLGSVYIQRSTEECKSILKAEFAKVEDDIEELDKIIKNNVHKLRDLEHEPRVEGFTLKPISAAEAKALNKAFGRKV